MELVRTEDVEGRMEQGKLSIHIRIAEEEKKLRMTLLFEAWNWILTPLIPIKISQEWGVL